MFTTTNLYPFARGCDSPWGHMCNNLEDPALIYCARCPVHWTLCWCFLYNLSCLLAGGKFSGHSWSHQSPDHLSQQYEQTSHTASPQTFLRHAGGGKWVPHHRGSWTGCGNLQYLRIKIYIIAFPVILIHVTEPIMTAHLDISEILLLIVKGS